MATSSLQSVASKSLHRKIARWEKIRELQNTSSSTRIRARQISPRFVRNGGYMKTRTSVLTLALCFVAAAVCFASDVQMGTWKLNEAKSKLAPGAPKNNTVVLEIAGDSVKVTVDGTDRDGKPAHNEWTGKFDGKDYPVTGDPDSDARSYKKIDDRRSELTLKKDGKVTVTGRIVVSADGKTRTVTTSGTDPQGKKFKSTSVYDKQ
jgi:hypothetical protein